MSVADFSKLAAYLDKGAKKSGFQNIKLVAIFRAVSFSVFAKSNISQTL